MGKTKKPKSYWRERRKDIKHKWQTPFIYVEWLCERVSYFLGRWALLDILGHVGRFSVLASVVVGIGIYWWETNERRMQAENQRKTKHYQAWQVINAAHGKTGSGGRIEALQDLVEDKVSLASVDLSNAYLAGIDLESADLSRANLSQADLSRAKLSRANLSDANLSRAYLHKADLYRANLRDANLPRANLSHANLSQADLYKADLFRANLRDANLYRANLKSANLSRADLSHANLIRADLRYANLSGADLYKANLSWTYLYKANLDNVDNWQEIHNMSFANIYDVNNQPIGFIERAKKLGAKIIESRDEWDALRNKELSKKK